MKLSKFVILLPLILPSILSFFCLKMNVKHAVLELITDAADILNKCLIYLSGPDDIQDLTGN